MIVYILIVASPVLLGLLICNQVNKAVNKNFRRRERDLFEVQRTKPFSATEYLDRIERESLKLAERREQYAIVLWWGYDGLRLNEDGTAEWISRRKETDDIFAWTPEGGGGGCGYGVCSTARRLDGTIVSLEAQNTICNIDSVIQAHKLALQAQEIQALQSAQMQNMINCIRPSPYPAYLIQQTYSTNYLTYPGGCFGTYQS